MKFERFDFIDEMFCPNLFQTPEDEDWAHIVNEDFMLHLITNFAHLVGIRGCLSQAVPMVDAASCDSSRPKLALIGFKRDVQLSS